MKRTKEGVIKWWHGPERRREQGQGGVEAQT